MRNSPKSPGQLSSTTTSEPGIVKKLLLTALVAVALAAGCSAPPPGPDGPERVVFALNGGYKQWGRQTDINELDLGVTELQNTSSHAVRIRWLRIVSPPKALKMDSTVAYKYEGDGGIGITVGDLLKGPCRRYMRPYPVTDAVVAPHHLSGWFFIMGFTLTKPGRYYINRIKIGYTTQGRRAWQYQYLFTTFYIGAARPGAKPVSGDC
jgi:hypothetical protein